MVQINFALMTLIVMVISELGQEVQGQTPERENQCYDQFGIVVPKCGRKQAKYKYDFDTNECERKVACFVKNDYTFFDSLEKCQDACVRDKVPIMAYNAEKSWPSIRSRKFDRQEFART